MIGYDQHLFAYYWAKHPDLKDLPPLPEILQQLHLSEAEAETLRDQYAAVSAGGIRALKVLHVASELFTSILELYDEAASDSFLKAVQLALAVSPVTNTDPYELVIPAPHHLNGLLAWLNEFPDGAAPDALATGAYADICKTGGSPAKVSLLVEAAKQLGLVEFDHLQGLHLTTAGKVYASNGPGQGMERWEMTEPRRKVLLDFWVTHVGEQPILKCLEKTLLAFPAKPDHRDATQDWLKELGLITHDFCITALGMKVLRRIEAANHQPEALHEFALLLNNTASEIRLEIADLRQQIDALPQQGSGAQTGEQGVEPVFNPPDITLDDVCNKEFNPVPDERLYLEECAERLRKSGYAVEYNEVTNLYICARSGQLTILAGPPGVGKSSFVRRFAATLGHETTLKEISVRRGWTDDQQFLGAVNRLYNRYDAAPTGVVHHLLKAEVDRELGLYWFLLDEFNLSVPEFYFAEFISVLEAEHPQVRLYSNELALANSGTYKPVIAIGPNVHFFGTINLDETGFPLSPRLLDRANFVWLERRVSLEVLDAVGQVPAATIGPISSHEFVERRCPPALSEATRGDLNKVLDCLGTEKKEHGQAFIVSPRSIIGAASYIANSEGLLAPTDALDYAVLQRILPGLRGMGEGFGKRMQAFSSVLSSLGLKRSLRLLNRMRDAGNQHQEYSFISALW